MSRLVRPALGIMAMSLVLVGCSGERFDDLDQFMEEKRTRPGGILTPIPTFQTYEAFAYSATARRSPFDRPVEARSVDRAQAVSAVQPDPARPKEFLEQYTFDSLAMVGTLERGGTQWTLIRDPEGGVHRVKLGDFLGRSHGRVTEMTSTYVAVVEIVTDGSQDGWVERPRIIELSGL